MLRRAGLDMFADPALPPLCSADATWSGPDGRGLRQELRDRLRDDEQPPAAAGRARRRRRAGRGSLARMATSGRLVRPRHRAPGASRAVRLLWRVRRGGVGVAAGAGRADVPAHETHAYMEHPAASPPAGPRAGLRRRRRRVREGAALFDQSHLASCTGGPRADGRCRCGADPRPAARLGHVHAGETRGGVEAMRR